MTLQPATVEQFGGVDLRNEPSETRGAIDAMNVVIDSLGDLRSRPGHAIFIGGTSTVTHLARHLTLTGAAQLLSGYKAATTWIASNTSAVSVATSTSGGTTNDFWNTVQISTPAAAATYIASSAAVMKYDAIGGFTTPAGVPTGTVVGLSPKDNRLVVAGDSGFPARVKFSDPGAPETFGANNFVDVNPGDGEIIRGAVAFGNLLYVFKRTKIYAFYGTSADGSGNPIFNWDKVSDTVGLESPAGSAACVGPDGVYFLGQDGIYRIAGMSGPQKISQAIDPFFRGGTSPFWQGGTFDPAFAAAARLQWVGGKLYANMPALNSAFAVLWVWDPARGAWSPWDLRAGGIAGFPSGTSATAPLVPYFGATAISSVVKMDGTASTDAGTAISSRYRSAFSDMGSDAEKKVRETLLHGTGTVNFQWSRDWGSLGASDTVALGTSPAILERRSRKAMRGRLLSWQVSASSPWVLQRVTPMLMGTRHAGARTTA